MLSGQSQQGVALGKSRSCLDYLAVGDEKSRHLEQAARPTPAREPACRRARSQRGARRPHVPSRLQCLAALARHIPADRPGGGDDRLPTVPRHCAPPDEPASWSDSREQALLVLVGTVRFGSIGNCVGCRPRRDGTRYPPIEDGEFRTGKYRLAKFPRYRKTAHLKNCQERPCFAFGFAPCERRPHWLALELVPPGQHHGTFPSASLVLRHRWTITRERCRAKPTQSPRCAT